MSDSTTPEDYLRERIDILVARGASVFERLGTNHLTDETIIAKNTVIQTLRLQVSELANQVDKLEDNSPDLAPFRIEERKLKSSLMAREAEILLLIQEVDQLKAKLSHDSKNHIQSLRDIMSRQAANREFTPVVVINDRLNRELSTSDNVNLSELHICFWINHPGPRSTLELELSSFTDHWPEVPMQIGDICVCLSSHTLGVFLSVDGDNKSLLKGKLLPGWNKTYVSLKDGLFSLFINDQNVGNVDTGMKTINCSSLATIGAGGSGTAWKGELLDLAYRLKHEGADLQDWQYIIGNSNKWNTDK